MVLLYLSVIIPFIKTFLLVVESKVFHILHYAYLKSFLTFFLTSAMVSQVMSILIVFQKQALCISRYLSSLCSILTMLWAGKLGNCGLNSGRARALFISQGWSTWLSKGQLYIHLLHYFFYCLCYHRFLPQMNKISNRGDVTMCSNISESFLMYLVMTPGIIPN